MDRRQNNRMLRQCLSGIAQQPPHHVIAVPTAMHKDNVRSSAVGKQLKQKKSNSLAKHHLPALDLFWASFFLRVQLTSLLLILPGLSSCMVTAFSRSLVYCDASTSPRRCQDFALSELRHKSGFREKSW